MIATKPQPKTHQHQKNYIICPLCRTGKLIFEDADADDVPIRLILPGSKRKAKYHVKCDVCKKQVGFSFRS
jgi:hypothetical protein